MHTGMFKIGFVTLQILYTAKGSQFDSSERWIRQICYYNLLKLWEVSLFVIDILQKSLVLGMVLG